VVAAWGDKVLVSKLAAIIKPRPDGTEKVRIIIDMLRSGINAFVRLSERIVLPRLRDVVANAMWMMGQCLEGEEIEQVVIDFSDAFKTLPVREEERPLQIARADGNTFVGYDTIVFGGGGSPLVGAVLRPSWVALGSPCLTWMSCCWRFMLMTLT
jgi:hypothetical protein